MIKRFTFSCMMLIASAGLVQAQILEDFETPASVNAAAWGGYEAGVFKNPLTSGINTSDTCLKVKKKWGPWDGSFVNLSSTVDYGSGQGLAIKVWSTKVGTAVMVKVEHGSGGAIEVAASTTVAEEWETLNFDYSGIGTGYDNVVFLINAGSESVVADSILVDDIELVTFAKSPNATLSALQYDATDIPGMHQTIFSYDVELPSDATTVPTVTATETHSGANAVVAPAASLPGTTTVLVTAEDGVSTITYSINFTVATGPTGPTAPATAAPTPPVRKAAEVISIFSDAYTDIASSNFNPWWEQSTVQSFDSISGDAFLKYASFNYQGTQFGSAVDASAMEYLHVDMWTSNATSVNVFCVDNDGVDPAEVSWAIDPIVAGEWKSYDIPMTTFSNAGLNLTGLHQFKFDGGDGSVTIYLDNLYFHRTIIAGTDATLSDLKVDGLTVSNFSANTTDYTVGLVDGATTIPPVSFTKNDPNATAVFTEAATIPGTAIITVTSEDASTEVTYSVNFDITKPATSAPVPPIRETADVISVFSDAYANLEGTEFNPNWNQNTKVAFDSAETGNPYMIYSKLDHQGIILETNQDVSDMDYVHVDMWTMDADAVITFYIIKALDAEHGIDLPVTLGEWVSYNIPISTFADAGVDVTAINQLKTDDKAGANNADIVFDNIYFYKTQGGNNDASLSDLSVNGTTITNFNASTLNYTVELAAGTTTVPTVAATTTDANADAVVTDASSVTGTTSIVVTAEDEIATLTYSVEFTVETNSIKGIDANSISLYTKDGLLHINCEEELVNGNIEVFDITGRKLISSMISSTHQQISLIAKGILIVNITDALNQHVNTQKLISR